MEPATTWPEVAMATVLVFGSCFLFWVILRATEE